jgi:CRISPR-associated protein Cas1
LHLRQYQAHLDVAKRREIGLAILREKVRQSENVLVQLSRFYPEVDPLKFELQTEDDEGRISVAYFAELAKMFKTMEFEFTLRRNVNDSNNTHATNPVNALLNFGYSILEGIVRREVNAQGLDSSLGFVHSTFHTSEPLVFDLQELYRWLVDLSAIDLLETKPNIEIGDFVRNADYSLRLTPTAARRLIGTISTNLNVLVQYHGRPKSYESILSEQVRGLALHLLGRRPLKFDTPVFVQRRNDDGVLREPD